MHKRKKGYRVDKEVRKWLRIDCYVPPPPDLAEIDGFHLPKEEQYWRPTPLPQIPVDMVEVVSGANYVAGARLTWEEARREEIILQTGEDPTVLTRNKQPKPVAGIVPNPRYVNPFLEEFRKQELARTDPWGAGYWFMNGGEPTYLTGLNYLYLNYWYMMGKFLPFYKETDRWWFYGLQWVLGHREYLSFTELGNRGDGKTEKGACAGYGIIIRLRGGHMGIQSKTETDARETVFKKKLVASYKRMPDFLVPINSNPSDPEGKLDFSAPSVRGKLSEHARKRSQMALGSVIDYRSSGERAYDGESINYLLHDEEGKTEECDVSVRHGVVKDCLVRANRKIGIKVSITTPEEMDKGGGNYKKLISMHQSESPGGINVAKGVFMYLPAYLKHNEFLDKYGRVNQRAARAKLDGERATAEAYYRSTGDEGPLRRLKLAHSYTIEEIWESTGGGNAYDAKVLRDREGVVNHLDYQGYVQGDFKPIDEFPGPVRFERRADGNWQIIDELAEGKRNAVLQWGGSHKPHEKTAFAGGFDPVKNYSSEAQRKSSAAGTIFCTYWDGMDSHSKTWVAAYVHDQPKTPKTAMKEFLYGCYYFGAPVLVESNTGLDLDWFEQLGMLDFLLATSPSDYGGDGTTPHYGLNANTKSNTTLYDDKQEHLVAHGHKLALPWVVSTSITYDHGQRTKHDLDVASQIGLFASSLLGKSRTDSAYDNGMAELMNNLKHYKERYVHGG